MHVHDYLFKCSLRVPLVTSVSNSCLLSTVTKGGNCITYLTFACQHPPTARVQLELRKVRHHCRPVAFPVYCRCHCEVRSSQDFPQASFYH